MYSSLLANTDTQNPAGQKVAVLGVAFIEDSDDPRNTPTTDIVHHLTEEKYEYAVHDPHVRQEEVDITFSSDINSVIRDSDALIVVTAHQD